jgi:Flp pilus assembly protein CpaB
MELSKKSPRRAALTSRTGVLTVAAATAFVAALLVFAAINSARKDGTTSSAPVLVLVANQVIPKGSSGQAIAEGHLLRTARVGEQTLVPGAVTDVSALRDKVATADIYPGQQISSKVFTASDGGLTSRLGATDRAMSIPLDSAHGLVGDVGAGDRVDVLAGFNVQGATGGTRPVMKPLASDILVLKTEKRGAGASSNTNVTLRVSAALATKLAFAAENGKVWLILRPAAGAKDAPDTPVSVNSLLFGLKPLPGGGR